MLLRCLRHPGRACRLRPNRSRLDLNQHLIQDSLLVSVSDQTSTDRRISHLGLFLEEDFCPCLEVFFLEQEPNKGIFRRVRVEKRRPSRHTPLTKFPSI